MSFHAHTGPGLTASLADVALATGVMTALAAIAAMVFWAHLTGRTRLLARVANAAAGATGLPVWAALPAAVGGIALLTGAFGLYWDAGLHIDNGRDDGPFGNPSHYAVLGGLAGIAGAGMLSIVLAHGTLTHEPSVRIRGTWRAPIGGVVLTICGLLASFAIPLDEVWHQLFGLDVAIWGPTHVLAIGGGSLATLALWMLVAEGDRVTRNTGGRMAAPGLVNAVLAGGFLLSLTTLHSEFEMGFPQFSLLYHPTIVVLSGAIGLVAARRFIGPGGALQAVAVFLALRGAFHVIVDEGFGLTSGAFPLYVAEAVAVELAVLVAPRRWPLVGGAMAGAAVAVVGLPVEWWWSHEAMRIGWSTAMLPEIAVLAVAAGVGGGLISLAATMALQTRRSAVGSAAWWAPIVGGALVLGCLIWPVRANPPSMPSADITVKPAGQVNGSAVAHVEVRIASGAVEDAAWLTLSAWQGQDRSVVQPLRKVEEGHYRTTQPAPVGGTWKTMIRLHRDRSLVAVPVYLPADSAIGAEGVPARSEQRAFVSDRELLQREYQGGPGWVLGLGYLILALIVIVWIAALTWGLRRLTFPLQTTPLRPAAP